MDRYWLNVILLYNNDIKCENINKEYENLSLISNHICNNKIIPTRNLEIPKENINKCKCSLDEICITNNLNGLNMNLMQAVMGFSLVNKYNNLKKIKQFMLN